MPRYTKKTSKNLGGSSSQQQICGSSSQQQIGGSSLQQQEGCIPVYEPPYWTQQSPYVYQQPMPPPLLPIQQQQLFQNMNAFGTQSTPPQQSQQFQSPQFQQFQSQQFQQFQSQQFQQYRSQEVVPESEPEYEDEDEDQHQDEDEDQVPTRGKAKWKTWTIQEESILGQSWCDVSQNSQYGNDQTGKQFWQSVTRRFNAELGKGLNYRTMHQCNSKWNVINKDVQKYNGIYSHLYRQPRSGENEEDLRNRADLTFLQDTTMKWKYHHVWTVVKEVDKWQQLPLMDAVAKTVKRRSKLSTAHLKVTRDEPFDVDLNEDINTRPLPMGRDQAKKKARTSGSSSARSEELGELKNTFANMSSNFSEHMSSRQKLKAFNMYMKDISHLHGEEVEVAKKMKEEIKRMFGF